MHLNVKLIVSQYLTLLIGIIKYIYCEEIDLTEDIAIELLDVASKYNLKGLVTVSENFLINSLEVDNCIKVLIAIEERNNIRVKDAALKFMRKNIEVFKTRRDEIHNLSKTLLIELLSRANFS